MTTGLRTINLVAGSAADIAAVDAVMAAAFDPRFGEAWTRSQCLGVMAMPGVWLTLAQRDGETIGFALTRGVLDEAELLLLAIVPAQRRAGIGGTLLRHLIDECMVRGITRLHLEVRAGNDAARLYAAHGFSKIGERRAYYRGGGGSYDAHSFTRQLG